MNESCDFEIPEWYSATWPVARKEHTCCECGAAIRKGERYGSFSGKWDRDVTVYRQHVLCEDACRYIRDHIQGGECVCFGGLFEWWREAGFGARGLAEEKKPKKIREMRALIARILHRKRKGGYPGFLPELNLYATSLKKLAEQRQGGSL